MSTLAHIIRHASDAELLAALAARGATTRPLTSGKVKVSVTLRIVDDESRPEPTARGAVLIRQVDKDIRL